jgi:hypothetical protein
VLREHGQSLQKLRNLYEFLSKALHKNTDLWIMAALTASGSLVMDIESFLSKSLLGVETSSQGSNFRQLKCFIPGLKKTNCET